MNIVDFIAYFTLPHDDLDPERSKFLWLIRLRWIYIILQLFLVLPFIFLFPYLIKKKIILLGICFLLITGNLISHGVLKFKREKFSEFYVLLSLLFDIFIFTALCSLIEIKLPFQIENVFFIHVALGGILLSKNFGILFCVVSALLRILISSLFYQRFFIENYFANEIFNQGIQLSIFMMANSLSLQVIGQREKLFRVKINAEKIDRLRAVGALSAGFSHEFSSPLNAIKLKLNKMLRKEAFILEDVQIAISATNDCERVIKKINHAQLDKRDFIFQNVDIVSTLNSIIDNWIPDHKNLNVVKNINVNSSVVSLPIINFSQSILYVLDNCAESQNVDLIEISISELSGKMEILIRDNGAGFSHDVLERYGEPFLTTKKFGTGLGLYSIQHFCLSINGEMSIFNQGGANVKIVIPKIQNGVI